MRKPHSANPSVTTVSSRLAAFAAASALAALAAACDVGDQLCPVGTNYNDKDDACPYGPPGGPKREAAAGCTVAPRSGDACTGVTWTATVFPILSNAAAAGCTKNGCHGDVQNKVLLPAADPAASYAALAAYKIPGLAAAYINESDPTSSWISCNLKDPPIGTKMPLAGALGPGDLSTIELWVGCGAPQ